MITKMTTDTNLATRKSDALSLFIESVIKPDHELRLCAKEQGCYDELMQIRQDVLQYLRHLRD